jgi:NADPH:quinone reductase-like Zn-dependent oxidoreductase
MRAIRYERFGGYEELTLVEVPTPTPEPGEVLVKLTYAGVSPLDNTVRTGKIPSAILKPLPLVPGGSGVGVVVESRAPELAVGARVMTNIGTFGLRRDGTWSEYLAAPPDALVPLPAGVDDQAAAAFGAGAGYVTAYIALTDLAGFKPGQSALGPGIGGAVGSSTVQVARALGAARAISTATSTARAERARAAGYDMVVDLSRESLRQGVDRLTDGAGVDVVVDGVGGPVTGQALGTLARYGTLVSVGYSGGMETAVNVTDLIWRAARMVGFTFSAFSPATIRAATDALLALLVEGRLQPAVDRVFPLAEAGAAQRHLIEGQPFGRVLLGF